MATTKFKTRHVTLCVACIPFVSDSAGLDCTSLGGDGESGEMQVGGVGHCGCGAFSEKGHPHTSAPARERVSPYLLYSLPPSGLGLSLPGQRDVREP